MKLMGAGSGPSKSKPPADVLEDPGLTSDPEEDATSDEGFKSAASEAMDALTAGDVDAFSDALKTCIQMFSA